MQAYNFRLTLTRNAANRIPITDTEPDNYDPSHYELLIRLKEKSPWQSYEDCLKWSVMPNDKCDMNNQGPFSTDMVGESYNYPEASYEEREDIYKRHLDYTLGLLYFMWTDPRIPDNIRKELNEWGWPRDEYEENNHITPQLYIRESRRMLGRMVMTQAHCERSVEVDDPIGYADYTMDSHNCGRYVVNGMVKNEGDVQIYLNKGPYGVSYRAVTPKEEEACNLIVPVCLSASHIAFGSIRMEPIYMSLGETCGLAACEAIDNYDNCVQQVVASEVMEHFEERANQQEGLSKTPCTLLLDEYIQQQDRPTYHPSPVNQHPTPSLSVNLTDRLLINPDFEFYEQDCQLLPYTGETDLTAAQGLPFGWQQSPESFSGMTRGTYPSTIVANAEHLTLGKGVYLCNQENFPTGFKFYQTIPSSQLIPGTYKVSCLMWIEKDKYGGCCLFANDNVAYWTASGYYKSNGMTDTDQEVVYADYAGGAPSVRHMRPMVVYVTIGEGEGLTFGIRTNSINNGTLTANAGYFIVDHFQLERVIETPSMTPSEFSEEVLVNNDFELNPDGTTMSAGNQNTWKLVGRDIAKVLGWNQNHTTDNYGITDGKCTNLHGKWSYWLNYKSAPIPSDFRFWQTVNADLLEPGVYEVACRMWQQRGLLGRGRLFADNGTDCRVMYYGSRDDYEGLLADDEQASFAGYSGSGTEQRNYNEVYVETTVDEKCHLDVGILSGYGHTEQPEHGLFHADFFRVWKRSNLPVSYHADKENQPSEAQQRRVTLYKSFPKEQWTAICLPFNMNRADIELVFGPDSQVAEPVETTQQTVSFQLCEQIRAGRPYLLYASHPLPSPIVFDHVDIAEPTPQRLTFDNSDFAIVGTYSPLQTDGENTFPLTDSPTEAFGAYAEGPKAPIISLDGTGIHHPNDQTTKQPNDHPSIYDLQGRPINTQHPSPNTPIIIVNGKKVIN